MVTPLQHLCRKIIAVITADLTHSQDGYTFWYSLPTLGKYSRRAMTARWAKKLLALCFPTSLIQAMTLACLTSEGIPHKEGTALRAWLLKHVYNNDPAELYSMWHKLHM